MTNRAEILIVDYEDSIPSTFNNLNTNGYRIKVVEDNVKASEMAKDSDLIIMLATERRRECIKLMEHVRMSYDPSINFILIIGGSEDPGFQERVQSLTFQWFKKYRFGMKELLKSMYNAIEMRKLRVKERNFINDLNKIEAELKQVENRLFTISRIREIASKNTPRLN